jgi:benzoate membrane transport protein
MSAEVSGAIAADRDDARGASFWRDLSLGHAANGLVGFLFAASGPLAIVLAAGTKGGLSEADLASWVFGSLFVNGLVSIFFCLRYRQPLVFFWTIPGARC